MEATKQDTKEIAALKEINAISENLGLKLLGLSGVLLLLVEADGLSAAAADAIGFLSDAVETMATKADAITDLSLKAYAHQ